jgi:hypothetical protein
MEKLEKKHDVMCDWKVYNGGSRVGLRQKFCPINPKAQVEMDASNNKGMR